MAPVPAGALRLDTCGSCRGVWFDAGELAALHGIMDERRPRAPRAPLDVAGEERPSTAMILADVAFALLRLFF